jgi:hypothetical protein
MAENKDERGARGLFLDGNQAGFGHRQQRLELRNVKLLLRKRHPDVDKVFAKILARAKKLDGLDEVAADQTRELEERQAAEQMISLRNQSALKAIALIMTYSVPKPAKNMKKTPTKPANPLAGLSVADLQRLASTDVEVIQ